MADTESRCVVDTVVLRYFLLARRFELLVQLVGSPFGVPRIVFDPEEATGLNELAMSEITRSIAHQTQVSGDVNRSESERAQARDRSELLSRIRGHYESGAFEVLDLSDDERSVVAELTNVDDARREFGLLFALDPGEAACVAIALHRGLVIATDDTDALRVIEQLSPGHGYERIQKLLQRAASERLVTKSEANLIHTSMRSHGFWDKVIPFPDLRT